MSEEEFVKANKMGRDLHFLLKMGFEVKLVRNENSRFNVGYMTHVTAGDNTEIISTPYQLEQVVNVLKMAEDYLVDVAIAQIKQQSI